jgi:arylsulfatase A-like enzyme
MRAIILLLCSLVVAQFGAAAEADHRPNIVILLADQWRACATGYAGDPNVKTPNLDRLAACSVNFDHAISPCPVCTPARASLLTGQRPLTHGLFLNDAPLRPDAVTMAKVLAAAGYDTGYIGKWHVGGGGRSAYIPPDRRQGFEYWKALECTHNYDASAYYAQNGVERLMWPGYDAVAQTRDATRYLADHARPDHKPFLLMLSWGPPHNPYQTAPKEYAALYDPAKLQLRPNVPPKDEKEARKQLAGYYGHISALDKCVGDVWQTLKDNRLERDTILIFTADHGDMLWSQGQQRKQRPWDESIRVPMLWHYPAKLGDAGRTLTAPICCEDVMPTLLDLCGVKTPSSVEGLDYAPHLTGHAPSPCPDDTALITCVSPFGEYTRDKGGREYRGLRTPRYTYVRTLEGPWLLYDDVKDPYQQHNLIGQSEAAEVQAQLDRQLTERLKAYGDEFHPGERYIENWGYQVDKNGTIPYTN